MFKDFKLTLLDKIEKESADILFIINEIKDQIEDANITSKATEALIEGLFLNELKTCKSLDDLIYIEICRNNKTFVIKINNDSLSVNYFNDLSERYSLTKTLNKDEKQKLILKDVHILKDKIFCLSFNSDLSLILNKELKSYYKISKEVVSISLKNFILKDDMLKSSIEISSNDKNKIFFDIIQTKEGVFCDSVYSSFSLNAEERAIAQELITSKGNTENIFKDLLEWYILNYKV